MSATPPAPLKLGQYGTSQIRSSFCRQLKTFLFSSACTSITRLRLLYFTFRAGEHNYTTHITTKHIIDINITTIIIIVQRTSHIKENNLEVSNLRKSANT